MKSIRFVAEVQKVQTLIDGGIRVTLDLSETAIREASALMECKRQGEAVTCELTAGDRNRAAAKRGDGA